MKNGTKINEIYAKQQVQKIITDASKMSAKEEIRKILDRKTQVLTKKLELDKNLFSKKSDKKMVTLSNSRSTQNFNSLYNKNSFIESMIPTKINNINNQRSSISSRNKSINWRRSDSSKSTRIAPNSNSFKSKILQKTPLKYRASEGSSLIHVLQYVNNICLAKNKMNLGLLQNSKNINSQKDNTSSKLNLQGSSRVKLQSSKSLGKLNDFGNKNKNNCKDNYIAMQNPYIQITNFVNIKPNIQVKVPKLYKEKESGKCHQTTK